MEAAIPADYRPFELILVNDGSPDESWAVIRRLAADFRWIRGLDLSRNYGQHNALLAGIRAAVGPLLVTLDDDLQDPPESIPDLLERLDADTDVVYGTPMKSPYGLLRSLATRVTKLALSASMGSAIAGQVSSFRLVRTRLRDSFATYAGSAPSVDVLLTWGTTRFASVPIQRDPRRTGRSNYTILALASHAVNMLTGFSTAPLQMASLLGFALTAFGAVILVYVVGRTMVSGSPVPGFPFLASIIAIFAGAQMFALGIIGEYLARMHFRLMDRPTYSVRDELGERFEP